MKKLLRAAGALSLGAASLTVAHTTHAAEGGDKPWTVSAALRGFYDDNIYTAPYTNTDPTDAIPDRIIQDSFGLEISPSLGYSRSMDSTDFSIAYTFLGRWFEDRDDDAWDHNHTVNLKFSHEFSPRVKLDLQDDFFVFQEPSIVAGGVPVRAEGDNIANNASASLSIGLAPRLSMVLGYRNNLYRYELDYFEATLDRVEHLPSIDFRFLMIPTTTLVVGYQYGIIDFEGGTYTLFTPGPVPITIADDLRDRTSHFVYAGVDHSFSANFFGSVRAGAQITEYDFNSATQDDTDTTPFIDGSLVYTYAPGSQATAGVRHSITSTDVVNFNAANDPLLSQETTLFYVRWNHAFTGRLRGGILGQFQNSEFIGGASNGTSENYWTVGVNASYSLTSNVALEAAYYHDRLDSDLNARDYNRNRVTLGVKASF